MVPIFTHDAEKAVVMETAQRAGGLSAAGIRVQLDEQDWLTPAKVQRVGAAWRAIRVEVGRGVTMGW